MSWSIIVEGVSKRYRRGGVPVLSNNLREDAGRWVKSLLKRSAPEAAPTPTDTPADPGLSANQFWALHDINLEIRPGDVVGLIGFNGSGKSTLLKIIARITEPTKGAIRYRGRLGSMLEVGTGFHRELTGRENIYLNGAILGMTRRDITQAFDDIVEFSGVGTALDTPVKFYSSGMYVRLAFSVAAHLRTDILLVDEVLAVGDVAFQDKCLGKMDEVARQGRTIVFVSHNMASVEKLCQRGVLLREGAVAIDDTIREAVYGYLLKGEELTGDLSNHPNREGSGEVRVERVRLRNGRGETCDTVAAGESARLEFDFATATQQPLNQVDFGIKITNELGTPVFFHRNAYVGVDYGSLPANGRWVCEISRLPLPVGDYWVSYHCAADWGRTGKFFDKIVNAFRFRVQEGLFYPSGQLPDVGRSAALLDAHWAMETRD